MHTFMSRRPPIAMLSLASIAVAGVSPPWRPATVRDLHSEYGNIFKHGNRNAASHLWVSFILQRASQLAPSKLEEMFTGFCAVSGSPTRPSDYTRYRLTLPRVDGGGLVSGFMYYCCWPCVCDTQDFIRVDTANVTLAGGEARLLSSPLSAAASLSSASRRSTLGGGERRQPNPPPSLALQGPPLLLGGGRQPVRRPAQAARALRAALLRPRRDIGASG